MNRQDAKSFEPPRRQDAKNDFGFWPTLYGTDGWALPQRRKGALNNLKWIFLAPWRLGGSKQVFLGALAVQEENDNEYAIQ